MKALWVVVAMMVVENTISVGNYLYQERFDGTQLRSLLFSKDSQTVYGGGTETSPRNQHGWVWAWDTTTGRLRWKSRVTEPIYSTLLSPKGDVLLTAPLEGAPRLWDTATGKLLSALKIDPALGTIDQFYFTPDGMRILGCCQNGIQIWDAATGTPHAFWRLPEGEFGWPQNLQFSADGAKLLVAIANWDSGDEDDSTDEECVQLWDARTGRVLERYVGASHISALSPAGNRIAIAARHYNYKTGETYYEMELSDIKGGFTLEQSPELHASFNLESLEFVEDGNVLCKGTSNGGPSYRDSNYGEPQAYLWNIRRNGFAPYPMPRVNEPGEVISPNKKLKAFANWGGYRNRPALGCLTSAPTGDILYNLEGLAGR